MEKSKALQSLQSTSLTDLQEMKGMAQVFVQSGMFEDVKDASQAFVKIMRGREMGFPPVTSMECIDVIQKRLFLKPRAIGALINACGYGSFEPVERTSERCVIQFRRKYQAGWKDLPPVEYTIETAKARGLVNRTPEWKTDPANMLFWRCLGRGGAQYFPELMSGLSVTPDHYDDAVSDEKARQNVNDLFGDSHPKKVNTSSERSESPVSHDLSPGLWNHYREKIDSLCANMGIDAQEIWMARERSYGVPARDFSEMQLRNILADLQVASELDPGLPFDAEESARLDAEVAKEE